MAEFSSSNPFVFEPSEYNQYNIDPENKGLIHNFVDDLIQKGDYDIWNTDIDTENQDILVYTVHSLLYMFSYIMFNKPSTETTTIIRRLYLPLIKKIDTSLLTRDQATNLYIDFYSNPLKMLEIYDKLYKSSKDSETIEKPIATALEEKIKEVVGPDPEQETDPGKHKIIVSLHGAYPDKDAENIQSYFPFHSLEFIVCEGNLIGFNPGTITENICDDRYSSIRYLIEPELRTISMKPYILMKTLGERHNGVFLCTDEEHPYRSTYEPLFDNDRDIFKNLRGEVDELYFIYDDFGTPKQSYRIEEIKDELKQDEEFIRTHGSIENFINNDKNIGYQVEFKDLMKNIFDRLIEKNIPPKECTIIISSCRGTMGNELQPIEKHRVRRTKRRRGSHQEAGKRRQRKSNKNRKTRRGKK